MIINECLLLEVSGHGELYEYFLYQHSEFLTLKNSSTRTIKLKFSETTSLLYDKKVDSDDGFIAKNNIRKSLKIGNKSNVKIKISIIGNFS